ncbi:MAG: ATP-binding protein [Chloroflexota bacterium]
MTIRQLSATQLRRVCDPTQFSFETTSDLKPSNKDIVGQPRASKSIRFGLEMPSRGYNIYVLGPTSMGHREMVEKFIKRQASGKPVPNDWVYVHDFAEEQKPKAIYFAAGEGSNFRKELEDLLEALKKELPDAFETESFRDAADEIRQAYQLSREELIDDMQDKVREDGLTVVRTANGPIVMPLIEGRAMTAEELDQLPVDDQKNWHKKRQGWDESLDDLMRDIRNLDSDSTDKMKELERSVAKTAISHHYDELLEKYDGNPKVVEYLNDSLENVLDNLTDFFPVDGEDDSADLRRYEANLLVDHSETEGAPVITELNPRYHNLMGRIEYESQHTTHFSNIKPGALHKANGGYLILNIHQLLSNRNGWDTLRRALTTNQILLQPSDRAEGNQVLTKSLDPAPIPLELKVILIGDYDTWYRLYNREDDFRQLFKVKAEFANYMARTAENELAYAEFVAECVQEENLRPFDRRAVASLVDIGSWRVENQKRLSTNFIAMCDLIREASFWASIEGNDVVTAADVEQAFNERQERSNLYESQELDRFKDGMIYIDTDGCAVAQINGLYVMNYGDFSYGTPARITARTWQGEPGIAHIERETEMAGPIHNKGMLTLTGFLGGQYAQDQRLNFSASLTFEQNYNGIDGDSASAAELIALLSSLGNFPIKQNIAITGSINQKGEIQPIGGATDKVEGFFTLCKLRGLNGSHGVILPAANLHELMLNQEVIDAVEAGQFHIWSVESIFEAIELLTGLKSLPADDEGIYPEGSLHALVLEGLDRLDSNDDDEDDEEENED